MDCDNARILLEFSRPQPGELDDREADVLRAHLEQCPDCGARSRAELAADAALSRAMKAVPIPDGLRTRLLANLDRHRDAWYRRFVTRRVLPLAAAAAALVAVAVTGWYSLNSYRVPLHLDQVTQLANERHHPVKDQVDQWLRQFTGEDDSAPPQFNYDRLEDYCITEFANQRVPTLFFACSDKGDGAAFSARVYVLTDRRFDVKDLEQQQKQLQPSGVFGPVRVRVLPDPRHTSKVVYLILYTGSELQVFFAPENKAPGV